MQTDRRQSERERFARGSRYGIVTGHVLATAAGCEALERDGSVVDAAVAAAAVLTVVLGHANSLGSDGFVLVRSGGRVRGFNGSGTAPAGATLARLGDRVPRTGPLAVLVPGVVRLWEAAHRAHGRLPWASLFDHAIEAAERGHALSAVLARSIATKLDVLGADPHARALYAPAGTPLEAGTCLRQPALAATLRTVAAGGATAFYDGTIARSMAHAVQAAGGVLDTADLRGYRVLPADPISTTFAGARVHAMPPNSLGTLMLVQLQALAGADLARLAGDERERLAALMNVAAAAMNVVKPCIGDPLSGASPVDQLLSAETASAVRASMHTSPVPFTAAMPGGTTGLVIVDAAGDAVSMLQSNFQPFGSGVLDPETGILLNNRMLCFSADPSSRNVLAPGRRPAHTLNPTMVTRGDDLRIALVTPGGTSQTFTVTQVLLAHLAFGRSLAESIDAPRWSADPQGRRLLEETFPAALAESLAAAGYPMVRASGANYFGSVKAVARDEAGGLTACVDHRREGAAAAA